jgi:sec-independent protein translocase protein TatA
MATTLLTPSHIAVLLVVLLLIFGPKRLPATGRALGHGMREFKEAITGHQSRSADEASLPADDAESDPRD